MKSFKKTHFLTVIIINLIIALAFFIEYKNAPYSVLSSDLLNILPVAKKFDNPNLYKNDLYLFDIDNVKYYTPFYVQSLRFIAKFTNYNYLLALNVLGLISHFLFGVFWYLLFFRFSKNFWLSLLLSIGVRGIIWLPGFEIFGITGLWSIMPRTLYIVFLPLPFLVLSTKKWNLFISAFLIGLIFNFHPITGLGGVLMYVLFIFLSLIIFKQKLQVKDSFIMILFLLLGMSPFLYTYFGETTSKITYDTQEFNDALVARIGNSFTDPLEFIKQWLKRNVVFLFLAVPIYYFTEKINKKRNYYSKFLMILTILLFTLPLLSVYVEQLVNMLFNLKLRLSFQLIRAQKIVLIPVYFSILFLLLLLEKYFRAEKKTPYFVLFFLTIVIFSKQPLFNKFPLISDDIIRSILPSNISLGVPTINFKPQARDRMAMYIKTQTPDSSVLASNFFYRAAAQRSVVLDGKGASMLIEGNPIAFIKVHKQRKQYKNIVTDEDKIEFLKSIRVDYLVTKQIVKNVALIHIEDDIRLYKL